MKRLDLIHDPVAPVLVRLVPAMPAVVRTTTLYLWILAPSFGLMGIVNVTAAAYNGLQRPFSAAGVAFMRLVGLYLPLAYVGRALAGLPGLFTGLAIGNVIAGITAYLVFQRTTVFPEDGRDTVEPPPSCP